MLAGPAAASSGRIPRIRGPSERRAITDHIARCGIWGRFPRFCRPDPRNHIPDTFDWTSGATRASMWTRQEAAAFLGGVMSTVVSHVRGSSRRSHTRLTRARGLARARAPAVVPPEPTFAEIAGQYLERHI